MSVLAPLPVAVPLTAAALLLFLGTVLPPWVVRALAIVAALAEVVLAGVLAYDARSGLVVHWFGGWTPRRGTAIGVAFAIDQLGAGAAAFAGAIVVAALLIARRSFEGRALPYVLMLTMLAAMAGFCLTGDIFNLFVFYELMAVSAFGLAALETSDVRSLRGALNFAITNSIGAFFVLIGIALLYGRTGALNLAEIGRQLAAHPHVDGLVVVAVTMMIVGFLVKAAVMPFHFWLVDVASTGTPPLVLLLAGVLDTLAVFAIARLYWTVFAPVLAGQAGALRGLLVGFGATSALLGAALALSNRPARRQVAFVLVAHTGTLLVGVGCLNALGVAGAVIYAVAGGAIKAAVVCCTMPDEPAGAEGAGASVVTGPGALLFAAGIALAGLPLFGIALGEALIERAAATAGLGWIAPVLIAAAILSGAAVLRIALEAMRSRYTAPPKIVAAVATTLVAAAIGVRFAVAAWAARAASSFVATTAYARAVLDGAKEAPRTSIRGVGIATSTELVYVGAVVAAIALVAWIDWLRPKVQRDAAAFGGTRAGNAIRRLHDGGLGDSVAWLTVGATVFALVLTVALR